MNYGRQLSCLIFICFAFVPLAFSQDSVMVLDHKELGQHQRSLVNFNHEKHASGIECLRCHHDYDKHGNNKGGEGQPCSVCHTSTPGKVRVPLEQAFHAQCKACHATLEARGTMNVPLMCGECHVRK